MNHKVDLILRSAGAACGFVVLVLSGPGCSGKLQRTVAPNRPPVVRLAPPQVLDSDTGGRTYDLRWTAEDPDGKIREFVWALDPPSADVVDACWEHTTSPSQTLRLERADTPSKGFHWFAVRAIDDRGGISEPAVLAIGADNVPPTVRITCPQVSASLIAIVPPAITINWEGTDPDGIVTNRPVSYKYLLLGQASEYSIDDAIANPDAFRDYYANHPSGPWTGWAPTTGETTFVSFTNLLPGARYLFTVIAFDEQGAYSPVFNRNTNMLEMQVGYPQTFGPRITLIAPGMTYAYPSGGYYNDAAHRLSVETSSSRPVTVSWFATPTPGSCGGVRYRWVLDPERLDDPAPRTDPADVRHWSDWSDATLSATVGPFSVLPPKRAVHTLYLEADDGLWVSLGIIDLVTVPPAFAKDLLFVDDTRLRPDQFLNGNLIAPQALWPQASELDTFLFARGGVPWQKYPEGTLSPTGLLAGYEYDTLGTRGLLTGFVPLTTLAEYRHVVWYVDQASAGFSGSPNNPVEPITALRSMSAPGRNNALAAYVALGGHLWIAGGGVAYANLIAFNNRANDPGGVGTVFSRTPFNELGPGRLMFDAALWQSTILATRAYGGTLGRFTGRHEGTGAYATVPVALEAKTTASDPLPPLRTAPLFYLTIRSIEALTAPNEILDAGVSALDTLVIANGTGGVPVGAVAMSCSSGPDPHVVFSGFDFWSWRRSQCVELVDFVLRDLWGLQRSQPAAATNTIERRPPRR